MHDWIVAHEPAVRLAMFGGVLAVLLLLEALWPRRATPRRRVLRWSVNLPMVLVDSLLVRLIVPLGATGAALWSGAHHTGLLNRVALPLWLSAVIAFVVLDGVIYWQHRIFHRVPWFWRLHRMHHSDVEFDATTALRFHPVEILLSMLIKVAAVVALGAPAIGVIVFEIALNGVAMFNHANLAIPTGVDRVLRRFVVTPDMHRVHHSTHQIEHDSNYGFNLPWWDHLFRSYTDQPREGHTAMVIGLTDFREIADQRLLALLTQPLRPLARQPAA